MIVDGILIGQFLGTNAMASYGFAAPILIASNAIFGVFATGVQSTCGNCMGRGDMKSANGYFNATMFVALGISVVVAAALIIFSEPLVVVLGANGEGEDMQEICQGARAYIIGLSIGIPFQF